MDTKKIEELLETKTTEEILADAERNGYTIKEIRDNEQRIGQTPHTQGVDYYMLLVNKTLYNRGR